MSRIKEPRNVIECKTKEEWAKAMGSPAIRHGEWEGPGYYAKFSYSQRCPRGCCYDDVTELKPITEHISDLKNHIRNLASSLRYYRELNHKYEVLAKYSN